MALKFIDLFAGIGGFRRGMELAGHKCVGFCEWDKFASESYRSMHLITTEQRQYLSTMDVKRRQKEILKEEYLNGEWFSNDIRTVDARSVPKCDCWCFGAPCQDFSIAGHRKGLGGDRSSLIREVFRIVAELKEEDRPEYLIYENVKGMLSSNNGWDFACILVEMESLGYDLEYQLLNSKDYGVPQNRERVYVIGHLRNRCQRKVFPISGADTENSVPIKIIGHRESYRRNTQVFDPDGITEALYTGQGGGRGHYTRVMPIGNVNPSGNGMNGNVFDSKGLAPTLTTNKGEGTKVAIPCLTPGRANKRQNGRRFKEDGDPMFTLTAQDIHGVMVKEATKKGYSIAKIGDSINLEQPNSKTSRGRVGEGVAQTLTTSCNQAVIDNLEFRIRKLTPKECFRLQGWTDDYFDKAAFVNSDSQLYKQAGNGVTVNVVYEIAKRL